MSSSKTYVNELKLENIVSKGGSCDLKKLDIDIRINEGPKLFVERVNIFGNTIARTWIEWHLTSIVQIRICTDSYKYIVGIQELKLSLVN